MRREAGQDPGRSGGRCGPLVARRACGQGAATRAGGLGRDVDDRLDARQFDCLDCHGELVPDAPGRGPQGAVLACAARSATTSLQWLRSCITVSRAGVEVESEPVFFEGDTVADGGPTPKGVSLRAP